MDNLSFRSEFVEFFRGKSLVDPVVVSPDAGGVKNAKKFADALGYPLVLMHKQRSEHSVSEVTHVIGELEGKTPILLDDMVDGGGSACGARAARWRIIRFGMKCICARRMRYFRAQR